MTDKPQGSLRAQSIQEGWIPASVELIHELGASCAMVYGCFWQHCDEETKRITISQRKLAGELHISLTTFKKHLRRLVEAGYISIDKQPGKKAVYYDTEKVIPELPDWLKGGVRW